MRRPLIVKQEVGLKSVGLCVNNEAFQREAIVRQVFNSPLLLFGLKTSAAVPTDCQILF